MDRFIMNTRRVVAAVRLWAKKNPMAATDLMVHIVAAVAEPEDEPTEEGGLD